MFVHRKEAVMAKIGGSRTVICQFALIIANIAVTHCFLSKICNAKVVRYYYFCGFMSIQLPRGQCYERSVTDYKGFHSHFVELSCVT